MRGIRLSDRVLIAGQTGKGKTTFSEWLVAQLQPVRVIHFDVKEELSFPEIEPARTPEELVQAMHQPIVHYIPASFDRRALEEACEIVWITPGPYVWRITEASELTSPSYCPSGLRLGVTQGRKPRKMVIAETQRLAEIHPVFRSQSEHIIIFTPPPIELDLKTIAGNVRREASELELELAHVHAGWGDYSHIWYVRDTDELRRCAPIPIDDGPPRRRAEDQEGAPGGTPGHPGDPAGAIEREGEESRPCDSSGTPSAASSRSG